MKRKDKHITPPRLAERFLLWFLKKDLAEEVLGDLDEKFYSQLKNKSPGKAKRNYWFQVFNYLRPFALRAFSTTNKNWSNFLTMLKHNLLISYRSFMRFKSTFFINLTGLASGLACTLLIYLWVMDEMKIDRFHEKGDRIYQVLQHNRWGSSVQTMTNTPRLLASSLKEEFPEVESSVSLNDDWADTPGVVSFGETKFKAKDNQIDPDFFKIFSFQLLQGNPNNPIPDTKSVLISDQLAARLFEEGADVVGQTIHWDQYDMSGNYLITGVFEAPPTHSSKQFELLFSEELLVERNSDYAGWESNNDRTFLLLKEGTDIAAFNSKIENYLKTKNDGEKNTLSVQNFGDRYLYGTFVNAQQAGGRIVYVRLFSLVALFILIIACINFMNLTTAKASNRMKEIGVKKAIGAGRKTLASQYLSESLLLSFTGLLVALVITNLFLAQFNEITGKQLVFTLDPTLVIGALVITIITGLLSGSYPALYLSGLHPIAMLKGKLKQTFGDTWLRKGLVIFQFAISAVLITAVMVVSQQIDYIQSKNLGYNKDNLLRFDYVTTEDPGFRAFIQELKAIPGIVNAAGAVDDATGEHGGTSNVSWSGKEAGSRTYFEILNVGYDFLETMNIEMAAGRSYETGRDIGGRSKIIFNEAAIKAMGLKDPIGKTVQIQGEQSEVIGVVKDFHFQSMYKNIAPLYIQLGKELEYTLIRLRPENISETMAAIEEVYDAHLDGVPFDFTFIDADYDNMYRQEQSISALARYFAGIAIVISCLGLLGLTAFTAEKRSKEVGIRKVLGSGSWRIVYLLSSDFTRMILVALMIGLPISYFVAKEWIQNFAYGIDLGISQFLFVAILTIGIAWLAVGLQTMKAANANPVDALRSE
ncbi:MAG: FtsX-like permease family protein [Roseivirga sp.]|nr:FtsX-like permease family protein [Roseivirga sp.]